jgi:hypothetical protein
MVSFYNKCLSLKIKVLNYTIKLSKDKTGFLLTKKYFLLKMEFLLQKEEKWHTQSQRNVLLVALAKLFARWVQFRKAMNFIKSTRMSVWNAKDTSMNPSAPMSAPRKPVSRVEAK